MEIWDGGACEGTTINALDFVDVLIDGPFRVGIFCSPSFVALHRLPKPKPADVIPQDAGAEIDIVFDLQEINTLSIRNLSPGRQMNLHDPNCPAGGDGERIRPALNDDNAGKKPWI